MRKTPLKFTRLPQFCALFCTLFCVIFIVAPAFAQEKHRFGITPNISTLGMGLEGHYIVNDRFGIRVPLGFFRYTPNNFGRFTIEDQSEQVDSTALAKIGGFGVFADWYPWAGKFRVSGGLLYSFLEVRADLLGTEEIPITINNVDFESNVRTSAKFKKPLSPMISIGYAGNLEKRIVFNVDAGFIYNDGYDLTLTQTGGVDRIPEADVTEQLRVSRERLNKSKYYPYLKFGVTFAF